MDRQEKVFFIISEGDSFVNMKKYEKLHDGGIVIRRPDAPFHLFSACSPVASIRCR